MSPISARTARLLSTRKTLLKPGLPDPTLRISIPLPNIEKTAKGTDPIAKQARHRTSIGMLVETRKKSGFKADSHQLRSAACPLHGLSALPAEIVPPTRSVDGSAE